MKRIYVILAGALVLMAASPLHSADALTEALQKGLFEEEANHNLDAAIKAYQDVLARTDEQRRVAATALFRLAECYRKQGKTNEATGEYRRLVRDYADQSTLVNLSRQNLAGLGASTPADPAAVASTDEEQQEIQRIRVLIKNSPDLINTRNRDYGGTRGSVLHEAAYKGHLLVAEYLLASGADLNALDEYNATPLYQAARNGHKRMVELLLAKGANPSPSEGGPPLHIAVERGYKGVVDVLLAHKANVNARSALVGMGPRSGPGKTALHIAVESDKVAIAELLITNGADVNAVFAAPWNPPVGLGSQQPLASQLALYDGTPLHFAVQRNHSPMVQLLLAKSADVNARSGAGLTPLHYTAYQNRDADGTIARILLDHKADVNARAPEDSRLAGFTPLHMAVFHQATNLVRLFLEQGADPNLVIENPNTLAMRTALHTAIDRDSDAMAELLLKHKADINERDFEGATPLVRAAWGKPAFVELLLAYDPDLTAVNSDGNSPLALAVQIHNLQIAERLLAKGANPNGTNGGGYPLLHVALNPRTVIPSQPLQPPALRIPPRVQSGGGGVTLGSFGNAPAPKSAANPDKTMLELLLEYKADPNRRDPDGYPVLHRATGDHSDRRWSRMEMLIAHKADVNGRDSHGNTPLHVAAASRDEKAGQLLLEHKADPNATNKHGSTPLFFALGYTNFVGLLVKHGADVNWCNNQGETPFMLTIKQRYTSQEPKDWAYIELMLRLGADILKSCKDEPSPFEFAHRWWSDKLIEAIRKHHPKKLQRVDLEGHVSRKFRYFEADKNKTLSQIIAEVGLTEKANPQSIDLMRDDPKTGFKKTTNHDLIAIREKRAPDITLQEGDKIIVGGR